MISILCAAENSNYKLLPGLEVYDFVRDAYTFSGQDAVITHAPCAQWSRMKAFARSNQREKDLAAFCFDKVITNGGIFEHPAGSSFFKFIGADMSQVISVHQCWWGFPARKNTYLYFAKCKPVSFPITFDLPASSVCAMHSAARSIQPVSFCKWLIDCVISTF
jgi:hypothetical protein